MSPSHSCRGIAPALRGGAMSVLAPALAACLLFPTLANAQDAGTTTGSRGGIEVNPISIGGEDVNTLEEVVRLGIDDCEAAATVVFDLDGVPSDKSSIDIYIGDGCNSTNRMNADLNRCTHLATKSTNSQTRDLSIEITADVLFDGTCDDGMEAERSLWFLAVDDPMGAEDVGTGYGELRIELDGLAPNPPSSIEGGSGERQIEVDWDTDEANLEGFLIYIDATTDGGGAGSAAPDDDGGAASGVDCGSGRLRSGSEAPDPNNFATVIEVNESTATGETLSPEQIGGTSAAIAVVAIDLAGNRSKLSDVACVSVMPTESFWDRYEASGGAGQAGCPCSALGPVHAHSAWPVALALFLMRRSTRRRRRS